MPEELRSKEEHVLSKKKADFQPDFVIPGKENKPKWTEPKKSGPTFWSRLSNIFKSKPTTSKKSKEDKKSAIKHISKPGDKKDDKPEIKIEAGAVKQESKEEKRDFNIPELKPIKLAHEKEKHKHKKSLNNIQTKVIPLALSLLNIWNFHQNMNHSSP